MPQLISTTTMIRHLSGLLDPANVVEKPAQVAQEQ